MARFKDFGSPAESDGKEALTFKIYNEEFTCYAEMPGKTMLDFVKMSGSEDPIQSASAITKFFEKVLVPESFERFNALAEDPKRIVTVQTLADIVGWILEEYSNRPLEESERSSSGA